jgi:hypothetical protein
MISCWQQLEIGSTTDLKTIKEAYASKLKNTRPDEKPEEFQQLHKAYKRAISYAKNAVAKQTTIEQPITESIEELVGLANRTIDENESNNEVIQSNITQSNVVNQREPIAHTSNNPEYLNINEKQITEQPPEAILTQTESNENLTDVKHVHQQQASYEALVHQCDEILTDSKQCNKQEAWTFLLQSDYILDTEFNTQLGLYLFDAIDNHNLNAVNSVTSICKGKKHPDYNAQVNSSTLHYLNTIFHWSTQVNLLYTYIDEDTCNRLLPILEDHQNQANNIQSLVKGGVINVEKAKPKNREQYTQIVDAYGNVIKLFNIVVIVVITVLLGITLVSTFSENDIILPLVFPGLIVLVILQWFGLRKKHKLAYYLMWPFSVLLLFQVPIGTIWGGIFLINLYKCRQYYRYH